MKPHDMTHRTLAHSVTANDGTRQYVINYSNLEGFQTETVDRVNQLASIADKFVHRLSELEAVLTWVGTHRPEAILDYKTTHAVINRLEDETELMEREA